MSSQYDADAIDAAADISAAGATGTLETTSTAPAFDATTNTWTPGTPVSVRFSAVQINNDEKQLALLNLLAKSRAVTLLVAASGLTVVPSKGVALTWAGVRYVIDHASAVAPDGTPILYTVVASV